MGVYKIGYISPGIVLGLFIRSPALCATMNTSLPIKIERMLADERGVNWNDYFLLVDLRNKEEI